MSRRRFIKASAVSSVKALV
ncbi:MAG: twin-arginine translocation signal domain-containing protein [Treponema sp.]|nr:twin-arginine translocation signal domain-containing protein [Treponema sp.]